MAPVIWGLDLAEIHWSKFKSSYMWNRQYHQRRTKFIVYQLALIFCVVSESLGTAALSDYIDQQKFLQQADHHAYIFNNDYVGAAAYNIFAGVFVAFVFGAAFFFDLFFPERKENNGVRLAWKVCGVLAVVFHLAAIITLTVITATHKGYLRGISQADADSILSGFKKNGEAPLDYKLNGRAVAALVFGWLGFIFVVYSCVLLFHSIDYIVNGPGPKSKYGRQQEGSDPEKALRESATSPGKPGHTAGQTKHVTSSPTPAAATGHPG